MSKKNQKGFTLLELLVVVAIIGVIATIGIVSLSSFRVKGRDTKRIADLKSMQGALELAYEAATPKAYPGATESSQPAWPTGATNIITLSGQRALPLDPINNTTYFYQYVPNGGGNPQGYILWTTLENATNKPKDSLTGTVNGIACGNAIIYCVGL